MEHTDFTGDNGKTCVVCGDRWNVLIPTDHFPIVWHIFDCVTLCWKHYRGAKDKYGRIMGYKVVNGRTVQYVKEYLI